MKDIAIATYPFRTIPYACVERQLAKITVFEVGASTLQQY